MNAVQEQIAATILRHTDTGNGKGGFILCLCGSDWLTITEHCKHTARHILSDLQGDSE